MKLALQILLGTVLLLALSVMVIALYGVVSPSGKVLVGTGVGIMIFSLYVGLRKALPGNLPKDRTGQ